MVATIHFGYIFTWKTTGAVPLAEGSWKGKGDSIQLEKRAGATAWMKTDMLIREKENNSVGLLGITEVRRQSEETS